MKIKKNDIRNGNVFYSPFHKKNVEIIGYVKDEKSGKFKVQFETNDGILLEPLSVLKPILITKDILESCGFSLGLDNKENQYFPPDETDMIIRFGNNGKTIGIWVVGHNGVIGFFNLMDDFKERNPCIVCSCLHQLQNAYYIFSKKELDVSKVKTYEKI